MSTNQEILTKAIQKAKSKGWETDIVEVYADTSWVEHVIFNHDFAKALWEEELNELVYRTNGAWHKWQYHLQQMVVADDSIAYLGENI